MEWQPIYNGILAGIGVIATLTVAYNQARNATLARREAAEANRRAIAAVEAERLAKIEIARLQVGSLEHVSSDEWTTKALETTYKRLEVLEIFAVEERRRMQEENENERREKHAAQNEVHVQRLKYELQIQELKAIITTHETRIAELEKKRHGAPINQASL